MSVWTVLLLLAGWCTGFVLTFELSRQLYRKRRL
jgi:hypothetical protein